MKKQRLLIILALSCYIRLFTIIPLAQAERLESDSYIIQFGNFNVTSGTKTSSNFSLTDTVGQTADGPFSNGNYFTGSGFQYLYQIGEFSFSISDLAIDFGELTIGAHSSATNYLTVSAKGAGGYTVYAFEDHPMTHENSTDTIADTTCDAGDCSQVIAQAWINQNIPGFGFNMTGTDIKTDFTNNTFFRQFADHSLSETMQPIMSSSSAVVNHQATVTYKIGVEASQAAGNYQTDIVFTAVPGY